MTGRLRTVRAYLRWFERAPRARAGEAVRHVRDDDRNPGWFFGIDRDGVEGYFPAAWFEAGAGDGERRALRDYDAMELTVGAGTEVECLERVGGWLFVRADDGGAGWIPASAVEGEADAPLVAGDLVLEPLSEAHAAEMFEVLGDPEIYRHLDHPPPPSLDHLREVYRKLTAGVSPERDELWLNWIVRMPGGPPLGYVQATLVSGRRAWVAYAFASRHWGRGHAAAAVRAMLGHLASVHAVTLAMATVEAANHRSIALLERLGFRPATAHETKSHELTATERLYLRPDPRAPGTTPANEGGTP